MIYISKSLRHHTIVKIIVIVQLLSCVQLFVTPWSAAHEVSLSFTISQSLLKFMSIESMMPFNYLILCCPFLFLPSIFPSIRVFSNESTLHIRCPIYWSFSISPSNDYSGLIFLRIDWFDLFSSSTTCKYQFFRGQPSSWTNFHIRTWLLGKP